MSSIDHFWAVIPAGGAGTRLWPLSRSSAPKFLHDLTGSGRTLLQGTLDRLAPLAEQRVVVVTGRPHRAAVSGQLPEVDPAAVDDALRRLERQDYWVDRFDGSTRSLAAVKRMTSELIGRFSAAAEDATRQRFGPGPLSRYDASLIVPDAVRVEVAAMKAVAATYVMLRSGVEAEYERQRELLQNLVTALLRTAPDTLEPWLVPRWVAAPDDAARTRVVLDQVASLTDVSAQRWHTRLCSPPPAG